MCPPFHTTWLCIVPMEAKILNIYFKLINHDPLFRESMLSLFCFYFKLHFNDIDFNSLNP